MIKLSKTSKLDGIMSWSLQAIDTCPGSIDSPGVLVDACKGCYATTGMYNFPAVKAPREFNHEDWKRPDWALDMVYALRKQSYFRWFDSGDMYSLELAEKIYQVMLQTPHVKHWLPTRMAKFAKFDQILTKMSKLPNVMVRFSSDSISGDYIKGIHGSVIVHDTESADNHVSVCRAYEHGGKCSGCRACYDKAVSVIAYPAHGKKMQKVIRLSVVAA